MINWTELFTLQKKFDTRIIVEKGLEGTETIPWRVTAFQVELAEFANEGRWFKMWSDDRRPRRAGVVSWKDTLLEEFVDALHFAIGIALELDLTTYDPNEFRISPKPNGPDPNLTFHSLIETSNRIRGFYFGRDFKAAREHAKFLIMFLTVIADEVGFRSDEIEAAFKEKDVENHRRQDRGY